MARLGRITRHHAAGSIAFCGIALLGALMLEATVLGTATAAAQSIPQRMANPYYSTLTAAPTLPARSAVNAAATLAEPHVVYPASTTSVVNPKGLPRDRVAALRAAVQVSTLNEAYRAGSTPIDVVASSGNAHAAVSSPRAVTTMNRLPTNEPPRFAPSANATQMPTSIGANSTPPMRRDAAVEPVAWMSDTPSSPAAPRTTPINAASARTAQVGNPLRRDAENGAGNPLR